MTTARQFMDLLDTYSRFKGALTEPSKVLHELPDAQFRLLVYTAAELLSQVKAEAIRRGIWDELKTKKVVPS